LCLLAAYFTGVHLVFSFETHYLVPLLPVLSVLAAAPVRYLPGFSGQAGPFNERPAVRFILPAALCVILATYALSVCLLAAETLKPGLKPLEEDAVETLTAVVNTRSPAELAAYHNQKGVLKLFSRDYKSAEQDFVSAINASPYYSDPYLNLAYALRALGEPEAALSACRTAEEKCRTGTGGNACPGPALGSILRCQEISLSVLGKKNAARAVAARRSVLENKTMAELQE
ncbi:MAG: hypothetical protein NTY45_07830, partial [Elusimicrobia bacterium]|nr:hypothetical protein [Elusimicrobiota bacterium]